MNIYSDGFFVADAFWELKVIVGTTDMGDPALNYAKWSPRSTIDNVKPGYILFNASPSRTLQGVTLGEQSGKSAGRLCVGASLISWS